MVQTHATIVDKSVGTEPHAKRLFDITRRYGFSGLLSLVDFRFEIDRDADGDTTIELFALVPDRDSNDPQEISSRWVLPREWLDSASEFDIRQSLEKEFQRLWYHEYEEGVNFDGALVRDPHRWSDVEKYHAELLQAEDRRKQVAAAR